MSMVKSARKRLIKLLSSFTLWQCRYEYEHQVFERFTERMFEYAFVFQRLAKTYPLKVLDVGTGVTALPSLLRSGGQLVTASDNVRDYWPNGMFNRHYFIVDDDVTGTRLKPGFDAITCISVLEHIEDHESAVRNMFSLLNPGGELLLTCPYTDSKYIPNVYREPGASYGKDYPFVTQSFSRAELDSWARQNNARIVEQEYWRFWTGHCWTVGEQVVPPRKVAIDELHQHTCVVLVKPES